MKIKNTFLIVTALLVTVSCDFEVIKEVHDGIAVETYPQSISKGCRKAIAKIYDQCSDQNKILQQALISSHATGKSILVIYGAESCIWCHVFDKYINGLSHNYNYAYEYENEIYTWDMRERSNPDARAEAKLLNEYVANNFIIVHIEGEFSPNGIDVIASTGMNINKITYYPFIFVLDKQGNYVKHMLAYTAIKDLEIREDSGREYRGFDRKILLAELKKLRSASRAKWE